MKTVYVVPATGFNPIEDFYPPPIGKAQIDHYQVLLRETLERLGFKVAFTRDAKDLKDFAGLIAWERPADLSNLLAYPRKQCILLVAEPPVVDPDSYDPKVKQYFGTILTMMDDYVDQENYFKLFQSACTFRRKRWREKLKDFDDRLFAVLINSNKMFYHPNELYSERRKVIQFFAQTGDLDLYGPGWHGAPGWKQRGLSFKEKIETLGEYKFCICYENMGNQRGYITEKLFDCFIGGCVPIYLGATNVTDYIPADTFIDARNFRTYNELYAFLKSMDRKTHEAYLEAANRFLHSDQMTCFTDEYNVALLVDLFLKNLPSCVRKVS